MQLEVKGLTLVQGINGRTDVLYIETNLPEAVWPHIVCRPATITMEIASNKSLQYCVTNFPGVPIEVI